MKTLLLIHTKAGMHVIRRELPDIIAGLTAEGHEVIVYTAELAAELSACLSGWNQELAMVVCNGGDGTIAETVNGILKNNLDVPVGYIPTGRTNDFARLLHIPLMPAQALERILRKEQRLIDIGRFNDRYFVNMISFGYHLKRAYHQPKTIADILRNLLVLLDSTKQDFSLEAFRLTIVTDGQERTGTYILGMVTNTLSLTRLGRHRKEQEQVLEDGKLECLFIRYPTSFAELQKIMLALINRKTDNEMMDQFQSEALSVICDKNISWMVDGEDAGECSEVTIRSVPKAVHIF